MLWQTLTEAVRERYPKIDLQLNAGASGSDISAAETKLGVSFPESLRDAAGARWPNAK